MKDLTLHKVPFNHLYADLSYSDFFGRYYPRRDGRVYAATYSFNHSEIDFWWRLEPTSTLFIDKKYVRQARAFVRRFPLFEVYSVANLHTKAIFFERSGVLLVGSQNIYGSKSIFAEVMLETVVPEEHRQEVVNLVFGRLIGKILTADFTVNDIRLHAPGSPVEGRPFLPCHRETPYWDIVGPPPVLGQPADEPDHFLWRGPQPRKSHRWIYHLKQYEVNGICRALAFDRGYVYCGDLDNAAFEWLINNCEVTESRGGRGPTEQTDSTMVKDRFYRYHPIASRMASETDYWIGPVKNRSLWTKLEEVIPNET
ncbi:MAG: hypothetical protein ACYC35_11330 [Pirellulales bacterium]